MSIWRVAAEYLDDIIGLRYVLKAYIIICGDRFRRTFHCCGSCLEVKDHMRMLLL